MLKLIATDSNRQSPMLVIYLTLLFCCYSMTCIGFILVPPGTFTFKVEFEIDLIYGTLIFYSWINQVLIIRVRMHRRVKPGLKLNLV